MSPYLAACPASVRLVEVVANVGVDRPLHLVFLRQGTLEPQEGLLSVRTVDDRSAQLGVRGAFRLLQDDVHRH